MCNSETYCHMAFPGCEPKVQLCASVGFSHILTNPSWPVCAGALGSLSQMFGTDAWKNAQKRHLLEILHLLNFWSITQAAVIVRGQGGVVQDSCGVFQHLHLPRPHAGVATPLLRPSHLPEHRSSPGSGLPGHLALPSSQHRSLTGLQVLPAHQALSPQGLASVAPLPGTSPFQMFEKLALHLRSHLSTNVTGSRRSLWSTSFKRPILAPYLLICLTVFKTLIAVRYTSLYFFLSLPQLDFSFMKAAIEAFCS